MNARELNMICYALSMTKERITFIPLPPPHRSMVKHRLGNGKSSKMMRTVRLRDFLKVTDMIDEKLKTAIERALAAGFRVELLRDKEGNIIVQTIQRKRLKTE